MTTTNKDTICVLPWSGARVDPMGRVTPCCLYKGHLLKDPKGPVTGPALEENRYHVQDDNMDEILHSSDITATREAMLRGERPATCELCWSEEDAGGWSKRLRENERSPQLYERIKNGEQTETDLVHWDINLGNICNLRCRMCGSHSSSLWARDIKKVDKELGDSSPITIYDWEHKNEAYLDGQWSLRNDIPFWDYLFDHITKAETVEFYGGEPLYQKKHEEIIQHIINSGNAGNIHLHYNTNGTVFNEKFIHEYWPQFKFMSIMFSVDGVGDRFNYMRNPAKWDDVATNIKKYMDLMKDNMKFELCPTANVMSYFYINELYEWAEAVGIPVWMNLLHDPDYLNIQSYPRSIKEEILNKNKRHQLKNPNEFMMAEDKDEIDTFWKHVNFWDKWRGEDFSITFPELAAKMVK
jgi:MoaA/NifB/PqqE/SkfB family radical SAM enzyme